MRVLIADDDPVHRRLLEATLRAWGHDVLVTGDGAAALSALRAEGRPIMAVLDWMMPGATGPEVCARVRADEAIAACYLVLLTSRDTRDDLVDAMSRGADDFMTKPLDRDVLRARLSAGERILGLQLALAASHARLEDHARSLEEAVSLRTAELGAAQRELQAASRLKDRILGSVQHELRTPVTKLLATGQLLQRLKPDVAPPRHLLATLVEQCRHLGGLLDQVLSARALLAEAADDALAEGPAARIASVLEGVAFLSQDAAAGRRVRLVVEPVPADLHAEADPTTLALVLAPLVDNALKFSPPESVVTLSAARAGDGRIHVTVADSGPGVPAEDAESVFAEFDQGRADLLTSKPAGLGLGLSVARRLARRMGGDVRLAAGTGRGATFVTELPALAVPVEA